MLRHAIVPGELRFAGRETAICGPAWDTVAEAPAGSQNGQSAAERHIILELNEGDEKPTWTNYVGPM